MTRLTRRVFSLGAAAALVAAAGPSHAHTPYRSWKLYRQKHLLIGSHRGDPLTFVLAREVSEALGERLPAAQARVARAKGPSRIASLMATEQLEVAVLGPEAARAISEGEGVFAAYGALPLRMLVMLRESRMLVAHARFPDDHAALVSHALEGANATLSQATPRAPLLPWHPGVHSANHAH